MLRSHIIAIGYFIKYTRMHNIMLSIYIQLQNLNGLIVYDVQGANYNIPATNDVHVHVVMYT